MKRWETEAVRLKYEGKTYRHIAEHISKMFAISVAEGTVRNAFAITGRLYIDYLEYEVHQNNFTEETARQHYKQMASWTPKAEKQLYKEAIKNKDYRLAWDILKNINDRAGLVVVRKSEVNIDESRKKPIENYQQFLQELERNGIDPSTGFRVATAKVEQN